MKRLYDKALMDQIAKVYGNEVAFLSEFSKALLDIIREGLIRDGQVRLHQFGTFKLKWMKSRNGVNPSTGKKIIIQARPRVVFTPAKALKERIEPNPPELQPLDQAVDESIANSAPAIKVATKLQKDNETQVKVAEPASAQIKSVDDTNVLPKTEQVEVESDKNAADVVVKETETAEPEHVVESIEDEVEIIEQIVLVLKSEVTDTSEVSDVSAEVPQNEVAEKEVPEAKTEWLDQSVINNIKEISELQYFSKTDTTAKEELIEESKEESKEELVDNKEADTEEFNENNHSPLDMNSEPLAEKTEAIPIRKEKKVLTPIFAIAASIIVLLAAGIVFNSFYVSQQKNVINESTALLNQAPKYVFSLENNETETEVVEVKENDSYVASAVHVPVEIVNDGLELNTLQHQQTSISFVDESSDSASDQQVTTKADDEMAVESDSNSIVVSSEKYDELQRVSLEQSVFFVEREHRLLNGDSLWRLAQKHYINPFHWPHIYQANHNKILNPDKVKIGKVVKLPTLYGHPDALTQQDKHNIATGYYYNYLYHKGKGNPYAYFSLIGVEKYDASLLIEYKEEIERSDINNLALLTE